MTTPASLASSLWKFDGNTVDSWSTRHGVSSQPATYTTNTVHRNGTALMFSTGSQQYVEVHGYQNVSYQSFTVEMWLYCTSLGYVSFGVFGQHEARQNSRSLHIAVRNYVLHFGFYDNDLTTGYYLGVHMWYHAAFVYDVRNRIQRVYLNGQQIGSRSAEPYQGSLGTITIGRTDEYPDGPRYFDGYIDEVSLVMRAKSALEVEDSAQGHLGPDRLVSWHSFDNDSLIDRANIPLPAAVGSVAYVAGRVNQAIRFSSIASYYQIAGFRLLGQWNFPYSMSLWVKPASVTGATLIHGSTEADGTGWCTNFLGFSSTGQIVAFTWDSASSSELIGPTMQVNNWAHIAATFSPANGLRLFINGLIIGTTGPKGYSSTNKLIFLTLGNSIQGTPQSSPGATCASGSIDPEVYYGIIDEFRVYAKELSGTEVWTLANP